MSTDVVESDPVPPKDASDSSAEEANRQKPTTAARRIRVNNNLLSTVFSEDSEPSASVIRTIKRCTYHKNLNSHDDIFGDPVAEPFPEHTAGRCRFTPAPDTKENIFGDSDPILRLDPSIRTMPSAHEDTFDSLFGIPKLTPNPRRSYEEDTHCKLFGDSDLVHRPLPMPHEDTQARLFGPPTMNTIHVTSRSEDTQLDLFGPQLPYKRSTKHVARSSLQLFAEVEAPSKPIVLTRAAKISAASYEKLFGPPLPPREVARPPPEKDTAMRLFGPAVETPFRSFETKSNPITGEYCTKTPSSHLPLVPSRPASGLTLAGPQMEEEQVLQKRQPPSLNWTKVNTITGDRVDYGYANAAQLEENKKEAMKLSSETEKAEESFGHEN